MGKKTKTELNTVKEHFINYLNSYGGDASTMEMGHSIILSFAGSDGPDITEDGIKLTKQKRLFFIKDADEIDSYIKEGCEDNYNTICDPEYKPTFPKKTWKTYCKENNLEKTV